MHADFSAIFGDHLLLRHFDCERVEKTRRAEKKKDLPIGVWPAHAVASFFYRRRDKKQRVVTSRVLDGPPL